MTSRTKRFTLALAIFASGFCGMIAEYSVSTVVGHLVGNSVAAYSIGISVFMLAMGIGGFLSKQFKEGDELGAFLFVEACLSIACAGSTVFLTRAAPLQLTWPAAIGIAMFIGLLIGFEIPLLMRFNDKQKILLKDNVAMVFGADYLGSFVAGLTFSLLLLDRFGLIYTPVFSGCINLLIALAMGWQFRKSVPKTKVFGMALVAILSIVFLINWGEGIAFSSQQKLFKAPIVYHEQTKYQEIVMTQKKDQLCLFLNGGTQFCSKDERRYHEMLVHPALWVNPTAAHVLILGGGDGMAVRELLKYEQVASITLVDLDPRMTELCRTHKDIVRLNEEALDDPRVKIVNADAFNWLMEYDGFFDAILIDLPDPGRVELAKLYSQEFYTLVHHHLTMDGVMAVQSTSPLHATPAFQVINKTLKAAGLSVVPYRIHVPSFGDWGFHIGTRSSAQNASQIKNRLEQFEEQVPLTVLNQSAMIGALQFEKGILPEDIDNIAVSQLLHPHVFQAYSKESWENF